MIESDTLRLLRECDAGIKMGVASIGEVTGHVKDAAFREQLNVCKSGHEHLGRQVEALLREYRAGGKSPSPVARNRFNGNLRRIRQFPNGPMWASAPTRCST